MLSPTPGWVLDAPFCLVALLLSPPGPGERSAQPSIPSKSSRRRAAHGFRAARAAPAVLLCSTACAYAALPDCGTGTATHSPASESSPACSGATATAADPAPHLTAPRHAEIVLPPAA